MKGTSRNPFVVTNSTRAPSRCSRALVATVVPRINDEKASGGSCDSRITPISASSGWCGEDGHLATTRSPVASSSATRSVNVPPVSMPHRNCVGRLITGLERSEVAPVWLRGAADASANGPWEEQILYARIHLGNACGFEPCSLAACSNTVVTVRRSTRFPRWPRPRSTVQRCGLSSSPAGACTSQGVRESRTTRAEWLHRLVQDRR